MNMKAAAKNEYLLVSTNVGIPDRISACITFLAKHKKERSLKSIDDLVETTYAQKARYILRIDC